MTVTNLNDPIYANDWLFADLNNTKINLMYKGDLTEVEQDHSYLVVCESSTDDFDATPLSTTIDNNIIYFKSAKNHSVGQISNYEYNLYYGRDYIKYVKATPYYDYVNDDQKTVFSQLNQSTINYFLSEKNSQLYAQYSATPSQVNKYQYEITRQSNGKYLLTYFNDGIDWDVGSTSFVGAKLSANFDGPMFKLIGSKGPDHGSIKYRVIKKATTTDDIESVTIDWTTLDCYSFNLTETEIINISNLEYAEYILEVETISDINSLSAGNKIYIKSLNFLRNFNFQLGEEQLNPNLSFVSIGGVR